MSFDESYGGRVTPLRHYMERAEEYGAEAGELFGQEWWEDTATDDEKESLREAVRTQKRYERQFDLAQELVSFDDAVDASDLAEEAKSLEDDMRFEYPERIEEMHEIFKDDAEEGFYRRIIELAESDESEEEEDDDDSI